MKIEENKCMDDNVKNKNNSENTENNQNELFNNIEEGEEDNDGHDNHEGKIGKSSSFASSLQISNTIMGAGILGLPVVMRYLGLILGSCLMIINALVTIYSVHVLLRCKDITNKYGYAMFAKITYSTYGSLLVKSAIILNNFGICCAYFRIFGDVCSSLVSIFIEDKTNFFVNNWNNYFYVIVVCLAMFPFIFKDDIDSLKNVSFLGVLGITIFFFSLIIIFIYKYLNGLIQDFNTRMLYPSGSTLDIITEMPTIFVAFTFQFNAFPIYMSMKNRENKEMIKATSNGVVFCLIVYLITGISGFLMYREKLTNTVLDNLRGEILVYKDKNLFIFVILIIINISFLISSTMSIPLMFFSLKRNFLNLIIFCKKSLRNKQNNEVNQSENHVSIEPLVSRNSNTHTLTSTNKSLINEKEKIILTILLYISLCVITITVRELKEVFNIVGSTAGNAINYIFPNIFLLKLTKTKFFSTKNIFSQILYIIGVFVLFLCLTSEIVKILRESDGVVYIINK